MYCYTRLLWQYLYIYIKLKLKDINNVVFFCIKLFMTFRLTLAIYAYTYNVYIILYNTYYTYTIPGYKKWVLGGVGVGVVGGGWV